MKVNIISKDYEVSTRLEKAINDTLAKCDKYVREDTKANVVVRMTNKEKVIEITVFLPQKKIVRVEKRGKSFYDILNDVSDNLSRQLRKVKERYVDKHKTSKSIKQLNNAEVVTEDKKLIAETEEDVVRVKKYDIDNMSVDEAINTMDMLGHDFYVFKNIENDSICAVYRRKSSGYGLIVYKV